MTRRRIVQRRSWALSVNVARDHASIHVPSA